MASLRAIPNLTMIRPGDANETAVAWKVAVETCSCPVLLVLSRQDLPTLDRSRYASADGLRRGAYVLSEAKYHQPALILIASGSEVALILTAAEHLQNEGVAVRCVSMPSWELFDAQPQSYREEVLPPSVPARLAVELGVSQGWDRYVGDRGDMLGIERFGLTFRTSQAQAGRAHHDVRTSVLSLEHVPRALAAHDTCAPIKLVADARSLRLLGARILAPEGRTASRARRSRSATA